MSNSPTTVMVTSLFEAMIVEPTLTRQLYLPESVLLRGEKGYMDDI